MTRPRRPSRALLPAAKLAEAALAVAALLAACAGPSGPGADGGGTAASASTTLGPAVSPAPSGTASSTSPSASAARSSASPRPSTTAKPHPPTATVHYVTHVPVPHGCLTVSPAIVGIKVYLVQKALHLVGHKERYDAATVAAVKAFQAAHGLTVTGTVGATTWAALGTGYDFCVDRYTAQPTVGATATASARIEAMIRYASARIGMPYVWGGAGPMGFDCSGLDLQALYSAGVVVPGITTDLHVQADFRTTHALYVSRLPHVPFSQRRRGDLIFYGSPITHMAIYLGGGRILEAVRPYVRTASTFADGLPAQPYVVRPFPG